MVDSIIHIIHIGVNINPADVLTNIPEAAVKKNHTESIFINWGNIGIILIGRFGHGFRGIVTFPTSLCKRHQL